jgi:uncharacterized protein (DUF305 family)
MTYQEFTAAMHASMEQMMREMHSARASGSADRDFLAMMIPHHAAAVEMARLQLLQGRDPLVRQLAEEIIAGQSTEIAAMQGRLQRLRSGEGVSPDGFPALGATRGPAGS